MRGKRPGDFLLAAGVSFIVAIAAAVVGCLLGFLFGIPRSLQRGQQILSIQTSSPGATGHQTQPVGQPQPNEQTTPTEPAPTGGSPFLTNTSLEEISDWLTKIIIGLGLVQFETVIKYLGSAANSAASFVAQKNITEPDSTLASPFFFALIIASLVSACFLTYLETRTRLTLLFVGAIKAGADEVKGSHTPGS